MAVRIAPKRLAVVRGIRSSSSSFFSTISSIPDNTDNYAQRPFAAVSVRKLLSSYLNLQIVSFDRVVELGTSIFASNLMKKKLPRKFLLNLLRRTLYRHFCGGEDVQEARRTVEELWNDSLSAILVYGLEEVEDNSGCDLNVEELLRMIEMASLLPPNSASFVCVKVTAICQISLLEKVSDLLRWKQMFPSLDLPWKVASLPIFSSSSPLYHTRAEPDPLTLTEVEDLLQASGRIALLCQKCMENDIPLLIDAEHTTIQPAIDYLTYLAAIHFNKKESPVIYATIQSYLRDAKERLVQVTEAAERKGISVGFKLVRGAYLARETELASSLAAASPIHANIVETHACFNDCACLLLEKIARGSGSVVFGTHNYESAKLLAAKTEELGIAPGSRMLHFSQLHGMADGLSYALRDAGFRVCKYLPIGPVDKIIPYLLRRAEENQGFLSSSQSDRELMRMELKKRLREYAWPIML